jgi:hypothetical protein
MRVDVGIHGEQLVDDAEMATYHRVVERGLAILHREREEGRRR